MEHACVLVAHMGTWLLGPWALVRPSLHHSAPPLGLNLLVQSLGAYMDLIKVVVHA